MADVFHASVAGQAVTAPAPQPVREAAGVLRGLIGLPGLLLPGVPRGDAGVVRVLPGYLTGDATTVPLRAYLRALGYRAYGWGLGTNRGDVERYADAVARIVAHDARRSGRPVRIVGWSLGGVIGREAARRCPQHVRQVITLGSPVVGGPKYTLAAASYRANGWDLEQIEAVVAQRNAEPMPVAVTAIYSKEDSVVAWQACLDPNPASPTRHVEVGGQHSELGISAQVLRQVGKALAAGR